MRWTQSSWEIELKLGGEGGKFLLTEGTPNQTIVEDDWNDIFPPELCTNPRGTALLTSIQYWQKIIGKPIYFLYKLLLHWK